MSSPSDPFNVAPSQASTFDPTAFFSMKGKVSAAPTTGASSRIVDSASTGEGTDANIGNEGLAEVPFALKVTQWFDRLSTATDRVAGIEAIGAILATHFGSRPIRIAIGGKRPKRVLDLRLGWLSRESDLWRDTATLWKESSFDAQWQSTSKSESTIGFADATQSSWRILVWVAAPEVSPSLLDSIRQPLEVMARFASRLSSRHFSAWTVMFGKHPKLTIGVISAIFLAGICFPVRYPVDCTAILEPVGERIVSAPFAAVLSDCHVRLGDPVRLNEVLLELDGRPLRLERESLQAESDQAKKEREMALASHRIADAQQAELKQKQLQRRIQLLDDRLARLQVRSPIDGIVVSGDLERFVGSPLETGQTLMEIAPLDRLSIEVEIPEMEIGYVSKDAPMRVRFAAAGGRSILANLASVSPAAEVRDDNNVFVGRMDLEHPDENLRPGMRGGATMYGPLRPFVWRIGRTAWERVLWWIGY